MNEQQGRQGEPFEDRYEPIDHGLLRTISQQRSQISRLEDFIEFLFDHSEHCDHITQSEAWAEFEKWQDDQIDNDKNKEEHP